MNNAQKGRIWALTDGLLVDVLGILRGPTNKAIEREVLTLSIWDNGLETAPWCDHTLAFGEQARSEEEDHIASYFFIRGTSAEGCRGHQHHYHYSSCGEKARS